MHGTQKKERTVDNIRVAAETIAVVSLALLVGVLFPELGVVADTLSNTSVRLLVSCHVLSVTFHINTVIAQVNEKRAHGKRETGMSGK
jgi:F0F1-type ATP synthase assembly protein I